MKIDMAQLGIPGIKLFIVHGKDEDALLKTFKETFGDGTEVIDHRQ